MTVERRDEKLSGASCSKGGECCPLEKSPSSLWCNYFPQLLTLHLNGELLSFWKCRDLEDPLDPKDLEDHVVNRYCKPIHYLWYIFLSPTAWLDAEGGGKYKELSELFKTQFLFFLRESLGEVTLWESCHLYIIAAWDKVAFGDRLNPLSPNIHNQILQTDHYTFL